MHLTRKSSNTDHSLHHWHPCHSVEELCSWPERDKDFSIALCTSEEYWVWRHFNKHCFFLLFFFVSSCDKFPVEKRIVVWIKSDYLNIQFICLRVHWYWPFTHNTAIFWAKMWNLFLYLTWASRFIRELYQSALLTADFPPSLTTLAVASVREPWWGNIAGRMTCNVGVWWSRIAALHRANKHLWDIKNFWQG